MIERVLSRPLALSDIRGRTGIELTANPDERAELAAEYDLIDVRALRATATVTEAAGGIEVEGRVTADIVQTCVVTLVPVAQHIDEAFSVRFVPPGSAELAVISQPHAEVVVDAAAPDPPEVLDGPALDLGAIVEEAFVLAIDPYPRAPGAALPEEAVDAEGGKESPFAVLARLKSGKP